MGSWLVTPDSSIDDLSCPGIEVSGGTVVSGGNSFYLPNSRLHSTNTKFEYDHSHFTENTGWLAEVRWLFRSPFSVTLTSE